MSLSARDLKMVREIALALPDVKESAKKLGTGWKVKARLDRDSLRKLLESSWRFVRKDT